MQITGEPYSQVVGLDTGHQQVVLTTTASTQPVMAPSAVISPNQNTMAQLQDNATKDFGQHDAQQPEFGEPVTIVPMTSTTNSQEASTSAMGQADVKQSDECHQSSEAVPGSGSGPEACILNEKELEQVLSEACQLVRQIEGEGAVELNLNDIRNSCAIDAVTLTAGLHQASHQLVTYKQLPLPYVRRHFIRQTSYKMAQQQPIIPPISGGDELLLPWHHASDAPPLSPTFEETNENEEEEQTTSSQPFSFDGDKMDFT